MPKNKKCRFEFKAVREELACPEPALEGSDYCIFHKPDKAEDEAKLFKEKIIHKLQNKDYDFIGYHFPEAVNFANEVFENRVDLRRATFKGHANFTATTFKDISMFMESTFEGYALFGASTFRRIVSFSRSAFQGYTDFIESTFKGNAEFEGVTFEDDVAFSGATFERSVSFSKSTVKEDAYFWDLTFKGNAEFEGVTFEGDVSFRGATFERSAQFEDLTLTDNASAEQLFRIAKNCYQRQGEYSLAGEYYYKERIAIRKQLPWYSPKRWLQYILLDVLCGYGERPLRAIRTGLGVLFGLALLYWKVGHIYPSPELFNKPDHALTFLDALYFSVVTFTTLGFGDWRPDPSHWIRYIVMSEAFIGAFLMALFIVTFARRMMR